MKMKKMVILVSVFLAVTFSWFLYLIFSGTMFMYRSEKKIEEKLLSRTPVGTGLEEVREYLKGTRFSVIGDRSLGHYVGIGPRRGLIIGDHSIRVLIGEYQGIPWEVSVSAFWIFEKGGLTEILVRKDYDGL